MICAACGYRGEADGPVHKYMTGSPACWEMFGEVLARDYSHAAYMAHHRLLTDAYCAQHSIGEDRRARQSLCIHGAALVAQFEHGWDDARVIAFLKAAANGEAAFPHLDLPAPDGAVTIEAIHAAPDAAAHGKALQDYGRAVHGLMTAHRGYFEGLLKRHGQ